MTDAGNPWLRIPVEDYEGHMSAVGQSAALRSLFAQVYTQVQPPHLAILGCTTADDLVHVDTHVTRSIVGVDVNAAYLERARERWSGFGPALTLVCADVLAVELPPARFALVHAALLLEYVDAGALLGRVRRWLAPGGLCSVVTQEPSERVPAVSATGYRSLGVLAGSISLRTADEVAALAAASGLRRRSVSELALPGSKRFSAALFESM